MIGVSNLPGRYAHNENSEIDSIIINSAKIYTHKYYRSDGEVFESSGTWRYDSSINYIFFEEFVFFTDQGAADIKGTWSSEVVAQDGEIRLIYSDEGSIFYYRKR